MWLQSDGTKSGFLVFVKKNHHDFLWSSTRQVMATFSTVAEAFLLNDSRWSHTNLCAVECLSTCGIKWQQQHFYENDVNCCLTLILFNLSQQRRGKQMQMFLLFFAAVSKVLICDHHFERLVSRQVVWRRAVGDHHTGGAAVPGFVQRAGSEIRHGRGLPGQTGELPREDVSKPRQHTGAGRSRRSDGIHPSSTLFPPVQAQPDADVLAVQPQDAAGVPRDHRDAARGPAPILPGSVLLLQRGEQGPRDRGVWPGPGEHGEHPAGPVLVLPAGGELRQRQWALGGPAGELRGARALHAHERWQEKRTNLIVTQIQPFLTFPIF